MDDVPSQWDHKDGNQLECDMVWENKRTQTKIIHTH